MLSSAGRAGTVTARQVPTTLNQADRLALGYGQDRWRKRPVVFGLRIRGRLDVALLELALTWTARRHSALRIFFPFAPATDRALCVAPDDIAWPLALTDLSGAAPAVSAATEQAAIVSLVECFDPGRPPLFRGIVLKYGPGDWMVGVAADHLVFDGASIPPFLRDLAQVYGHLLSGRDGAGLAREVSDFPAFCAAEREWLSSPAAERAIRYWEPIWDGMGPSPSSVRPTGEPGTEAPSGQVWTRALAAEDVTETRRSFPFGHLSPFALTASCVISVLTDITGRADCGILYPCSRRAWPGTADMVGCLLNRVMLRVDTAGAASLYEVARLTRTAILDSMEHTMVPFELLMRRFCPDQAGRKPQNPHVLVEADAEPDPPRLGDLDVSMAWPATGDAFRDDPRIMISLQPHGPGSFILGCGYQAGLFHPELVDSLMDRVADLLTCGSR
jgi:hypothetical protein